jgi:hypothetical protein
VKCGGLNSAGDEHIDGFLSAMEEVLAEED